MCVNRLLMFAVFVLTLMASGCTTYYKVNDTSGKKVYYTTDIENTKTGAIHLKDAKTGALVTLQSSEVKKISKDEFEAAVKKPAHK